LQIKPTYSVYPAYMDPRVGMMGGETSLTGGESARVEDAYMDSN